MEYECKIRHRLDREIYCNSRADYQNKTTLVIRSWHCNTFTSFIGDQFVILYCVNGFSSLIQCHCLDWLYFSGMKKVSSNTTRMYWCPVTVCMFKFKYKDYIDEREMKTNKPYWVPLLRMGQNNDILMECYVVICNLNI